MSETVYYNYEVGKNVTVQEGKDNFPLMTPVELPNIFAENLPLFLGAVALAWMKGNWK